MGQQMTAVNLAAGGRSLGAALTSAFGIKALTPFDPGIIKLADVRTGTYPGLTNPVTITPTTEALSLLGAIKDPLANYVKPESSFGLSLSKLLTAGFSLLPGPAAKTFNLVSSLAPQGGGRMSFADGDSSGFTLPTFGDLGQLLQGQLGQNLLNIGTQALSGFVADQFNPMQANMAAVPAVVGAGRAVATVGRGFFNRFPNLAVSIQRLRNAGKNVTRANLFSLMKRFGPDFLISGGILTAAAVSELAMAGPGRRRMNPGNIKALRRAHRRMKSFHHVCQSNDHLLHARRRRSTPAGNSGGTRITNVK
jgi:hypothetical protein